jgi:hypothetical protein
LVLRFPPRSSAPIRDVFLLPKQDMIVRDLAASDSWRVRTSLRRNRSRAKFVRAIPESRVPAFPEIVRRVFARPNAESIVPATRASICDTNSRVAFLHLISSSDGPATHSCHTLASPHGRFSRRLTSGFLALRLSLIPYSSPRQSRHNLVDAPCGPLSRPPTGGVRNQSLRYGRDAREGR